ncbi:MAG TPA: 16S rRNA (guanine(966)-N(2))-methyltransferase RsmD [Candidatus Acidoferrales bacterium]|nr:16S rRNA (guanine(966)-N(2))-methyltransferase RsmD [Candidatus Acidoferrales bacterium]
MRIVAGKYGSRHLKGPGRVGMRPTSDRLRETLFDILGPAVEGSLFVDAYAGTAAVGIEALSRGASRAIFIEIARGAVALIRANLRELGIEEAAEILQGDVVRVLGRLQARAVQADFLFLDPPYDDESEYRRVLEFLGHAAPLAPYGLVIIEHRTTFPLPEFVGKLESFRRVRQGDATLSFYRRMPGG